MSEIIHPDLTKAIVVDEYKAWMKLCEDKSTTDVLVFCTEPFWTVYYNRHFKDDYKTYADFRSRVSSLYYFKTNDGELSRSLDDSDRESTKFIEDLIWQINSTKNNKNTSPKSKAARLKSLTKNIKMAIFYNKNREYQGDFQKPLNWHYEARTVTEEKPVEYSYTHISNYGLY